MHHFSAITTQKKNKNATILGCGPSVAELSSSDWTKIKTTDMWTLNNWMIHDVIPDFYHLEIKPHRNGSLIGKIIEDKKEAYKNVNWILNAERPHLLETVKEEWFDNIYLYESEKPYRGNDGLYTPSGDRVKVSCLASMTIVLDIIQRMGYEKIYFCGVDLYCSEYFWTGNADYKHLNIPSIIETCKPDERNPKAVHATQERNIANFIKEFGEYNNLNFVNLSPKSELRNHIKTTPMPDF